MARYERFTFLVNKEERSLIEALAKNLQRSRSDAIRFIVIEAAKSLKKSYEQQNTSKDDKK